jgi:hypothetical protein
MSERMECLECGNVSIEDQVFQILRMPIVQLQCQTIVSFLIESVGKIFGEEKYWAPNQL